jgi:hypothetical protein
VFKSGVRNQLMVNDVSTWRIDHMPYDGVKQSGVGREGLRYAIQEMTESFAAISCHRVPQPGGFFVRRYQFALTVV